MIHDIDLVLDLLRREPSAMTAYGLTAFDRGMDHAVAHFSYEAGPLVTLTASRITEQKIRSIEITARDAYLEGDLLNKSIAVHRSASGEYLDHNGRGVKYRQESVVQRIHVPNFEPLFLELQHFVDCILENKPPLVPARDGLKALSLAKQVREAILKRLIVAGKGEANVTLSSDRPEWASATL
jgi:predicted dehydrogenase